MKIKKTNIWVYAQWYGMSEPKCIGLLVAQGKKGRTSFSFEYDNEWIKSKERFVLDPEIAWFSGKQFPTEKQNFGLFLDSMPDTWGRTLMQRKAAQIAKEKNEPVRTLHEKDFLLAVYDKSRMGALRFKLEKDGNFLDDNKNTPIPPWSSVRDLQYATNIIESDKKSAELKKWLAILLAPGSSLGGARPKANILDDNKHLWIAKFPSKNDVIDKAAWEYLAYKLATSAGVEMAECKIQKISGRFHTFFTKRFDRAGEERIHFASAMTMTGNSEFNIKDESPSYLEIAEFIQFSGSETQKDLHQLWRRIVFNIAISNTDDHLRNHGFIIENNQWRLSPAYDINPSIDKDGLALNIDMYNNDLDFELAKSVGEYFKLSNPQMDKILQEVKTAVSHWKAIAKQIGISGQEQELMSGAFAS
ncbi:MAG: HipA domain-containing protein [Bacteroidota bacterium]|nr:HipA domain-containing protein [Bacteroidota bacterium]